ncbi:vacuolar membrane protein [Aspergillus nomiae NRRL 13137]|uniref:Vacuolar membrane protein n=1 Tax=Aspergillus nomiae NRRL (strain ATCC 15546 / NRRL 13137 / CBS 260.88 / M93) TaxID=1509407 RepID=A0A0L1IN58_ASPN3|nr:vacuolar membrane protein [Aspergillus nomiae NRRL 13137]KNG80638.1 vacuolar membrane protein [Aspergillus nomiae NRRL 13137]
MPVSKFTSVASVAITITGFISSVSAGDLDFVSSTLATPIPTPTSQTIPFSLAGPDPSGDSDDTGECRLLGPFSLLVQVALGALALLSLVYKRWRERPQRPLKVWAFDVSKQVFGSAMLHLANLLMSMFSAGQLEITSEYKPNPCSFYILNLGIDTTLGIPILIFILHILNRLALYTPLADPPDSIKSGHYGRPPRATWWFKQSMIYFVGLLGMKICVFFLIQLLPFIVKVGDWALRWTEGNTAIQIIFVMLLFPVIMNAIQYYIIDIFIKKPAHEMLEESEVDDVLDDRHDHHHALLAGLEEEVASESEDDSAGKGSRKVFVSPPQKDVGRLFDSAEYHPTSELEHSSASSTSTRARSGHIENDQTLSSAESATPQKDHD